MRVPKYEPREETPTWSAAAEAVKGKRRIALDGTPVPATLYERARLGIGAELDGPAIVEQFDATTLIPPGWRVRVDGFRNLILQRDG